MKTGLLPLLSLVLAMVLWGSSFVAMKYALMQLDAMVVIFSRMFIAALCFAPFIAMFRRLTIGRKEFLIIGLMGFCEPCLYFLFEAAALNRTTASQASVITSLLPPMVAVAAAVFLKERLSCSLIWGFVLAAIGALWLGLAAESSAYAPAPLLGNFLEFLAMISATGYMILVKILSRSLPPFFLTATQAVVGTVFFLPFLFLPGVQLPETFMWQPFAAVLYLGVVVTFGAYFLYNYGISKVDASRAAVSINLIPVFAIFFGYFLLGERLSGWQMLACVLVFSGIFLSQSDMDRNKEKQVTWQST